MLSAEAGQRPFHTRSPGEISVPGGGHRHRAGRYRCPIPVSQRMSRPSSATTQCVQSGSGLRSGLRSGHLANVRRHRRYRDGQSRPAHLSSAITVERSPDSETDYRSSSARSATYRAISLRPSPASLTFPETSSIWQAQIDSTLARVEPTTCRVAIHLSHQSLRSLRPVGSAVPPRLCSLSFSCRAASASAADRGVSIHVPPTRWCPPR
jgi:hypothetical protein